MAAVSLRECEATHYNLDHRCAAEGTAEQTAQNTPQLSVTSWLYPVTGSSKIATTTFGKGFQRFFYGEVQLRGNF